MNAAKPSIVQRITGATGLSGTHLAITAAGIALTGLAGWYQHVHRFDQGFDAATQALEKGNLKLDGKVVKIMTDADEKALERLADIEAIANNYGDDQDETDERFEGLLREHARALRMLQTQRPPETDWGAGRVPDHARLRIDRIARERANDGSPGSRSAADDQSRLAGYPTANTDPE